MDWMHMLEAAITLGAAAVATAKHKKASVAEKRQAIAELAEAQAKKVAEAALVAAADRLEREVNAAVAEFEDLLKKKLGPRTAGGALLSRLSIERERAIAKGKQLALKTYREKMAE